MTDDIRSMEGSGYLYTFTSLGLVGIESFSVIKYCRFAFGSVIVACSAVQPIYVVTHIKFN